MELKSYTKSKRVTQKQTFNRTICGIEIKKNGFWIIQLQTFNRTICGIEITIKRI